MKKILILLSLFISLNFAGFAYAEISVTPYGAAEIVSGSCFLLDAEGERILIDCGLFIKEDNGVYSNSQL